MKEIDYSKHDIVIILGDFGGIWNKDGENNGERYRLKWLNEKSFTTVFVDGNHENFDRLNSEYEVVDFHGGKAHKIRDVKHFNAPDFKNLESFKSSHNYKSLNEGLLEIVSSSAFAYEEWTNETRRGGGHPWEVMRGGNSTHVDFYPRKDDKGYYFMLSGDHRKKEVALFYLALYRAGIPVGLYNGRLIANAFTGNDRIGIVPNEVFPRYCHSMFPKEDVIDFVNIYDDEMDSIKDYVTWYDIPEIHLIDNTARY